MAPRSAGAPGATIEVFRRGTPRYDSLLRRADGVRVALQGGSYNRIGGRPDRLPHDVAHLVVEEGFGLDRGLWGVLAGGGLVQNASFDGGRLAAHARRRALEIADAANHEIMRSEVLVRAAADLLLGGGPVGAAALRSFAGEAWWPADASDEAVVRVCAGLRRRATEWEALRPGGALTFTWGAPGRGAGA